MKVDNAKLEILKEKLRISYEEVLFEMNPREFDNNGDYKLALINKEDLNSKIASLISRISDIKKLGPFTIRYGR